MYIYVISVCIETLIEHKRRVHERTRIHEAAPLTNLHFLDIKDIAPVENVEGGRTLSTEEKDLVVSDLVSQAHIGRHPIRLVNLWRRNFLPDIARDVIALDGIHDSFLVNPASESEDIVVLKDAK